MKSKTTFAAVTSSAPGSRFQGTSPSVELAQAVEPVTTSTSVDVQVDPVQRVGAIRGDVRALAEDSKDLHRQLLVRAWQQRTWERAKLAPAALLNEIATLGFAWRDIARMVRVSVPAIQKWRRAGGVSGENRRSLAALLALCDEIRERYLIQEIASWFEMPLSPEAPVTPVDLYMAGRTELVLEYASEHSDPEQILTAYDPGWRERYSTDFEVFEDAEGGRSIRHKDR